MTSSLSATVRGRVLVPVLLFALEGCAKDKTTVLDLDAGRHTVASAGSSSEPPPASLVADSEDADVPEVDEDSGAGGGPPPLLPPSEPVCDAPTEVNAVAQLVDAAQVLPWARAELSTTEDTLFNDVTLTEELIVSDDLAATGDLVATTDLELTMPAVRSLGMGCDDPSVDAGGFCQARLRVEQAEALVLPGVLCDGAPPERGNQCQTIQIASGTRFRIRTLVVDGHPGPYVPYLEVLRPCSQPCASSELRCERTQLCWGEVEYCGHCDKIVLERCSCETLLSSKTEGAQCEYAAAPDVDVGGTCRSGFCASSL